MIAKDSFGGQEGNSSCFIPTKRSNDADVTEALMVSRLLVVLTRSLRLTFPLV